MQNSDNRLNTTWWALRVLFGFVPIAAGLDKFFNLLTNWEMYLNPLATKVIPLSPATFMHIVGIIEVIAGVVMLSRFTKNRSLRGNSVAYRHRFGPAHYGQVSRRRSA